MTERIAAPIDPDLLESVMTSFERARTLPIDAYASEEVLAWERRHFFDGSWVCICRSEGLTEPGDQRAVQVGERSMLLVRGDDGILRAFANVCRHRGHELVPVGETRRARGIRCPYHSWVYGLEGECRATPRFGEVPGFDRSDWPLSAIRSAEWRGWVFVNPSGDAPPIEEHVGNLDVAIGDYRPETLVEAASHEYVVEANWKIVVENYMECYHCPEIHPALCRVTPPESGDISYDEHPTGVWSGGPMILRDHAVTMSLTGESLGVPIPSVPEDKRRMVGYAALFPNLLISPHPDYVMTHLLLPVAHNRTWVQCAWLFPPEAFERPGFSHTYASEFWDITNREDWEACTSVQRGVDAGVFRPGPMSYWETGVWDSMRIVARGYLEGRLSPPEPMEVNARRPADVRGQ